MASGISEGVIVADGKVRENRLRRMAERQGLQVLKSRRRDPRASDYGTYMLVDPRSNAVVASGAQSGYGLTVDDLEAALTDPKYRGGITSGSGHVSK